MTQRIEAYLEEKKSFIETTLKTLMPEPSGHASNVIKAMNYTLSSGGKRIRPILCLAGAEAVRGDADHFVEFACALEFIHSYSLIHDDLPMVDNDDFRRGRPTNHKVFGEAIALLAGDGLLTMAFNIMTQFGMENGIGNTELLRAINMIGCACGYQGMVGGQAVDITYEGKDPDPDAVTFIHTHKTGALIAASVTAGAILGGGNEDEIHAINQYGQNIGLAFQIADDILNIEGEKSIIGKGVGSDASRGKMTYPYVFGLEKSKTIEADLIEKAVNEIAGFSEKAWPLRDLASYIIDRNK